jgi:cell volume regulation protein A
MDQITIILLGVSLILFFGFLAELIFSKTGIPDILLLILLGFALGPYGMKYILPSQIEQFAPIFTTFALLFLLYDGAFNIDLASFAKGFGKGLGITIFNFFIAFLIVTGIMYVFKFNLLICLLTGAILGGVSSAFVIPLIKQLKISRESYFILTLESALTDVLCIVFALTMMEIIQLQSFSIKIMIGKIASLFAIAGVIGVLAGILWIIIVVKLLKDKKSYMITIAYAILIYVISEFLNGNGAIAVLFLGIVLRNSKQLTIILNGILNEKDGQESPEIKEEDHGITVTSQDEEFFYSQISFFLKTFFFVYIGVLVNLSDTQALIIGGIIALTLMAARQTVNILTRRFEYFDRKIFSSIFAKGLAAAAIAQIVIINNVENAIMIGNITYSVIGFSILLSSIMVFLAKRSANH